MDLSLAEDYKSSLNDLNFNSKPLINMLTMLAEENKKNAAVIVKTIVDHISEASLGSKLPGLYLVDSIVKNVGDEYLRIFCEHIVRLFGSVFEKVDEHTRSLMFKLRQTWSDVLPNKILYNLDMCIKKLDPAWPVTAKTPTGKKIFFNPKFLERSVEEKKIPCVSSTSLNKEEKMKNNKGEVLKQLLVKQEQLKLLERKKQMSMKKQVEAAGLNASGNILKDKLVCNTKMDKISKTKQNALSQKIESSATHRKITSDANLPVASSVEKILAKRKPDALPTEENFQEISASKASPSKNVVRVNAILEKCTNVSNAIVPASNSAVVRTSLFKSEFIANETLKNDKKVDLEISSSKISVSQKKSSEKIKSDKNSPNKNKSSFYMRKNDHKVQNSNEKTVNLPSEAGEVNLKIKTEESKKIAKTSSTGKNIITNCDSKYSKLKAISHVDTCRIKANSIKILRKAEKSKISVDADVTTNINDQVNILLTDKSMTHSLLTDSEMLNVVTSVKPLQHNDKATKSDKASEPRGEQAQSVSNAVVSSKNDVEGSRKNDNDISSSLMSLTDKTCESSRSKHVIDTSDTSGTKVQESEPPKKKVKSEDVENLNPSYRKNISPVLFGKKDQDLRLTEVKLEVFYPEDHQPYSVERTPASIQPETSDEKFKSQKQHLHDIKCIYPSEHERYQPLRYSRGRFTSKRSGHPGHNLHRIFLII